MKRNVFGAFAIAGGLALWATVGASAQTDPTVQAKTDIQACADKVQLQTSLTGATSKDALENLQELNTETSLAKAEIVADANAALAELTSGKADEADSEDGISTLTLDAKILAIKTAACQALADLANDYNAAIAELKAEFTPPTPTVQQPKPEKDDVEKDSESRDTEREQPEQRQTQSSTEREGND